MSPIFMPFVFSQLHPIHFIDQFKTKEGQETLANNDDGNRLLLTV